MLSQIENFTLQDLAAAQRQHGVWSKILFALESGDETSLQPLPVSFSQFFLSPDRVLYRYWPRKKEPVAQFVVPECYVVAVLNLVHDTVVAGHPERERTLAAARMVYFWPTMRVDTDAYEDRCVKCAQHKGTVPRPSPILEYPPPARPWDVVSVDLLQLPASHQGSRYLLICVDHLSRYVVLASVKNKSAKYVAHALMTHLICQFSTPRVLLSDNVSEFWNQLLEEICKQFGIKQCFTVSYHPASNGFVERANRKILDVLRPVICGFQHIWEDWLAYVAASINSRVCESTGQSPYYIIFGVEKRLPYELLSSSHSRVYYVNDYAKSQLKVFSDFHSNVRERLQETSEAMCLQQHKRAAPVSLKVGDFVMLRVPERNSKLSPKFVGPRQIIRQLGFHKFEIYDLILNAYEIVHVDRLKKTSAQPEVPDSTLAESANTAVSPQPDDVLSIFPSQDYNLRPRRYFFFLFCLVPDVASCPLRSPALRSGCRPCSPQARCPLC